MRQGATALGCELEAAYYEMLFKIKGKKNNHVKGKKEGIEQEKQMKH